MRKKGRWSLMDSVEVRFEESLDKWEGVFALVGWRSHCRGLWQSMGVRNKSLLFAL